MLDDVDRRLADGLVRAPRATIRSLAAEVGLSETSTRARVAALFDAGIVEVTALVHPVVRGRGLLALVTLDYRGESPPELDEVTALDEAPWIARYHTGPTLLIQISYSSPEAIHAFLDEVSALPWVEHASVRLVFKFHAGRSGRRMIGHSTGAWEAPAATSVDRMDRALIACLRADGRASYTSLAHRVGLSLPAARRRIIALQAAGVIRFTTIVTDPDASRAHAVLFVDVAARHRVGFLEAALAMEGIVFVSELAGEHDFCCDILVADQPTLAAIVAAVIALPGVGTHVLHPLTLLRRRFTTTAGLREGHRAG